MFPEDYTDLEAVVIVSAAPYMGFAMDNIIVGPLVQPAPIPALVPSGLGALALTLCITAVCFRRAAQHRSKRSELTRPTE